MFAYYVCLLLSFSLDAFALTTPSIDSAQSPAPQESPLVQPLPSPDQAINPRPLDEPTFEKDFSAHITTNAITGPPGTVSLQRSPGANLNTNLLLVGLSVVAYERFEVGTVPIYFFEHEHKGNFLLKYNFWRGKEFFWTLNGYHARFDIDSAFFYENITYNFDVRLDLSTVQLAMNYIPKESRFSFGFSLAAIYSKVGLVLGSISETDLEEKYESGADISYSINSQFDLTLGFGYLRETGLTAYEQTHFGFGTSLHYKRDSQLFSSITLGVHYTPKIDDTLFLFSTKVFSFD